MTSQRDEFVAKMKQQLDDINSQVGEFEHRAEDAGEHAREEFDAQMDKLRQQGKEMQSKLDELRAAGEDSWDQMIDETRKIRDAFIHSVNYFRSQLK